MYRHLPRPERWAKKTTAVVSWAFTALAGVGGAWFTGRTVAAALQPSWLITVASLLALAGAITAVIGVLVSGRAWWLEWVGAALAGAGVTYYALVPWGYLLDGELGRMQQTGMVSVALTSVASRMVSCWVYSRRLIRQHRAEEATRAVGLD